VATIWNDSARAVLIGRLEKLNPDTKPQWGQFTVGKMVKHCADGVRMAMGELNVEPNISPLRLPLFKHAIIFVLPWPKSVPTAPELIPQTDPSLPVAIADLKSVLLRLRNTDSLVPHPAFGKLSRFTWGWLIHKHLDHHLKQFGV
jgi:hypothetical protein